MWKFQSSSGKAYLPSNFCWQFQSIKLSEVPYSWRKCPLHSISLFFFLQATILYINALLSRNWTWAIIIISQVPTSSSSTRNEKTHLTETDKPIRWSDQQSLNDVIYLWHCIKDQVYRYCLTIKFRIYMVWHIGELCFDHNKRGPLAWCWHFFQVGTLHFIFEIQ